MTINPNHDEDDNVTATQSRKKTSTPVPIVQGDPVEPQTPATAPAARTPEDMADRARLKLIDLEQYILKATAEIVGVLKQALPHAREAGRLLAEAKAATKIIGSDIKFAEWVNAKCGLTIQTANRYIRIEANWQRMTEAGFEPTSIEDAAKWISEHPAPDADKRGGAHNQRSPRITKLELSKSFLTATRLQQSAKSVEDWKAVVNEALQAVGVKFLFV